MASLIFVAFLVVAAIVVFKLPVPAQLTKVKIIAGVFLLVASVVTTGLTAVGYNDAGYCQHIRNIFGTESNTCKTGWYPQLWGNTTAWPHFITVAHTKNSNDGGTDVAGPYSVRLADNWNGDVTQTTRFGIPHDEAQFLKMARDFRSPQRLVTTTLRPAVTASLDSVANLYSMEEYYAGGKRDQFKTEYRDTVIKGRAKVKQVERNSAGQDINNYVAPSDDPNASDTSEVGDNTVRKVAMEKVLDSSGDPIREPHNYVTYGIVVSSAILENLDPDDRFEKQIQARKDAASRRIVAREERKEQEEQRLLAIQRGETNIATEQAAAKTVQIKATTDAETSKKLVLIKAAQVREEARISKETSEINLEKAKIDAQSVTVAADAEAYKKKAILTADGALKQKLDAWVRAQNAWADAASKINVPHTVFGGGGSGGNTGNALNTVGTFMDIMTAKAAKDLSLEMDIKGTNNPVK